MSACPVPDNSSLSYTAPPSYAIYDASDPSPEPGRGGDCGVPAEHAATGGGETGTSTTRTDFCVGPAGPCGKGLEFQGDWTLGNDYWVASVPSICSTDLVRHLGLVYICILDNIADGDSEPGVGADWETYWKLYSGDTASNVVIWRGYWQSGVSYMENDYVTHLGSSFMCTVTHVSDASSTPDIEIDYNGGPNWILVSSGDQPQITKEYKGFIEGIKDGIMDYVKKIPSWGVSDWLKAIAVGGGLIWAGSKLMGMLGATGSGDGQGSVTYNGTPGYTGSYTPPTVQQVLDDLLQRAGFDVSEYDLTLVPDEPLEGIFANNPTVGEAIDNIVFAYQLNVVNTGGVLKFTSRSSTSVATLGDGEFGYGDVGESTSTFTAKRLQSIDLPKKVMVEYLSRNLDYGSFSQETPFLESFPEGKQVSVSVPFVLTPEQSRAAADFMLIQPHLERNTWTGTTTYKWAKLEPGDVVNTSRGYGRIIEIQESEEGLLDLIFCDAGLPAEPTPIYSGPVIIGYSASDYIGSGVPATPEPINTNTVKDGGYSGLIVVDLPPLEKGDNTPRVYLAVHGYNNPNWSGAAVYKSTDGGATFNQIATSVNEATLGMVEVPLGNPIDYHYWDNVNTLDVELKTGSLQSKSEIAVLNGANLAMVGSEMIAFKTATLTGQSVRGNNIYRLSGLMRGLQGTEWVFDDVAHTAQELFVLIDQTLVKHNITDSEIRSPVLYKVVTFGGSPANVDSESYTMIPVNMVPWKVACPQAIKDCSTKDFDITWIMRSRSMGDGLEDFVEIEHDPDFGGWTVAAMNGLTEVRKWHVMTPYTKYTLDNQFDDFGGEQNSITFKIATLNRVHGTGYPTTFVSGHC